MLKGDTITYAARVSLAAGQLPGNATLEVTEWGGGDCGVSVELYSEYGLAELPGDVSTETLNSIVRSPGSIDAFRIMYESGGSVRKYQVVPQGWAKVTLPSVRHVTILAVVDPSATTTGIIGADAERPLVMRAAKTATVYASERQESDALWSVELQVPREGMRLDIPTGAVDVAVYTPADGPTLTTDFVTPVLGAFCTFSGRSLVPSVSRQIRLLPDGDEVTALVVFTLGA